MQRNATQCNAMQRENLNPPLGSVGTELKVHLDWREATRSEGWRPSPTFAVVAYVTREGCQPLQVVANLRDRSLHRLVLITYF